MLDLQEIHVFESDDLWLLTYNLCDIVELHLHKHTDDASSIMVTGPLTGEGKMSDLVRAG